MERRARRAVLFACVVAWASMAPAVKYLNIDLSAGTIAGARGVLASVFLFAIYLFVPMARGATVNGRVLAAAALSTITQFAALAAIAWGNTILGQGLLYAAPIYALVLGPLFKQAMRRRDTWPILIVACSLAVILAHHAVWSPRAIAMGVISAISFALSGFIFQRMNASECVLALAMASLAQVIFAVPTAGEVAAITPGTWIGLAAVGILTSALPNLGVSLALEKSGRLVSQTLVLSLEPLLAVALSWWLVNDVPGFWGIVTGVGHVSAVIVHELQPPE